jgi:glycosyltransferase involved in cell wall biosynthesis
MPEPLRIAYLVNRYPAVSHSFIRREIAALEQAGALVARYSIRRPDSDLPDVRDKAELGLTTILLDRNIAAILVDALVVTLSHPWRALKAMQTALRGAGLSLPQIVRRIAYFVEACSLVRAFRARPVDHVHAHFGTNPATVARLVFLLGGPRYSFTVHGPEEFDRPQALDLEGKIGSACLSVAISSFGKSQLMRWSKPADWNRIAVVRCGVDDSFLGDTDPAPIPDAPRLCCVARLSAQKGLPLLLEAAARLHRNNVVFHLTLIGDGEIRDDIERMIDANGLRDHITITGWASSEEVRRHILNSRAMVLPSFAEGLPVVIMEALALNRPVIATAIAGTPELVDAQCGWLIPAGSVEDLTAAMTDALSLPPATLEAMGAEGRQRVMNRHDSGANGRHLLALIMQSHGIG